jgi:hypothetical protein
LVHVLADTQTVLTGICVVFSHSGEVLVSASDEATTTAACFPIHYSLTMLLFETDYELLKVELCVFVVAIFWNMMLCSLLQASWFLTGLCSFPFQDLPEYMLSHL